MAAFEHPYAQLPREDPCTQALYHLHQLKRTTIAVTVQTINFFFCSILFAFYIWCRAASLFAKLVYKRARLSCIVSCLLELEPISADTLDWSLVTCGFKLISDSGYFSINCSGGLLGVRYSFFLNLLWSVLKSLQVIGALLSRQHSTINFVSTDGTLQCRQCAVMMFAT